MPAVEALLAPRYNYGVPRIVIQAVVNRTLCLEHLDRATTFLDRQYANNTLRYIAELWKHPVHMLTMTRTAARQPSRPGSTPKRRTGESCCGNTSSRTTQQSESLSQKKRHRGACERMGNLRDGRSSD